MNNTFKKGDFVLYNRKISRIQSVIDDLVILDPQGCKRLSDSIPLIVGDLSPAKVEIQNLIELGFENRQEAEDYYFLTYHDQLSLIYDKENKRVIMHNQKNIFTISNYLHELQDNFCKLTGNSLKDITHKCSCCK
jgi:signal peptidase I